MSEEKPFEKGAKGGLYLRDGGGLLTSAIQLYFVDKQTPTMYKVDPATLKKKHMKDFLLIYSKVATKSPAQK